MSVNVRLFKIDKNILGNYHYYLRKIATLDLSSNNRARDEICLRLIVY